MTKYLQNGRKLFRKANDRLDYLESPQQFYTWATWLTIWSIDISIKWLMDHFDFEKQSMHRAEYSWPKRSAGPEKKPTHGSQLIRFVYGAKIFLWIFHLHYFFRNVKICKIVWRDLASSSKSKQTISLANLDIRTGKYPHKLFNLYFLQERGNA